MDRKEFQLNEIIFEDGVYQNWMYSICEGTVDIYSDYGTSNEKKLVTLKKGQFFGEIGMIAVMPRTATAIAAEDHVVLEQISNDHFEDYLKKYPENVQPIMSSVSRRIRDLTEDMSGITQMTNALLCDVENENTITGRLSDFLNNLLGNLKARKASSNEFALQYKRKQALAGEIPPVIRLAAGNVIFRSGEEADCLYEICDGCVGIYSDYQTPDAKLLAKLHTEDVFGEMGVLDQMPRSATAVCLTDCAVRVIKPENFMEFFQQRPAKILQILQQMCIQLRDLTQKYLEACKTLEEMALMEEPEFREDEVVAKLECLRQSQFSVNLYDSTGSADLLYKCVK